MDRTEAQQTEQRTPLRGVRLGRLFGIEVAMDWSLLIIFALVTVSVGVGLSAQWHPEWSATLTWTVAVAASVFFFVSVLLHELSHAVVGRAAGIKVRGITLFIFGGMTQMEGRPPSPKAEFLMAVVGPITSLAIGFAALFGGGMLVPEDAARTFAQDPEALMRSIGPVATLLLWLGPINILLGIFNLIPGFPLDGGRVLRSFIWWVTKDLRKATRWSAGIGQGFGLALIVGGVAMALGVYIPFLGVGLLPGLWLVLIGWFLRNAAAASYAQLLFHEALEGVHVEDLMQRRLDTVDAHLTVAEFERDYVLPTDQQVFPVVDRGRLLGLVRAADIRRVPRDERERVEVETLATPIGGAPALSPDDDAIDAVQRLAETELEQIPVLEDGHVLGLVRQQDVIKWLSLHAEDRGLDRAA